jgi:Tol biopolymer transport system component
LKIVAAASLQMTMKALSWTLLLLIVISGCSQRMSSVRAELAKKQTENGLTLGWFDSGFKKLNFTDRTILNRQEKFPGTISGGVVSPDGAEVAVGYKSGLLIALQNGTELRRYPNVAGGSFCWSPDKTKLAMTVQNLKRGTTPPNDPLQILDLVSGDVIEVDVRARVSSQCWSRDGKRIVYSTESEVREFDIENRQWLILAAGGEATWSSDGNWIAFLDRGTYYAMSPGGDRRRVLFRDESAMSGLWWSPDSRIVAYLSRNRTNEPVKVFDVGSVRLRARRLQDGSEDWLLQVYDVGTPIFQWVEDPALKRH